MVPNVYPLRKPKKRTLVAEDLPFLMQALEDRARINKKWKSEDSEWIPDNPDPRMISTTPQPSLTLKAEPRKVASELAKLFSSKVNVSAGRYDGDASNADSYLCFIDPTVTYKLDSKKLDGAYAESILKGTTWSDFQDKLLTDMHCDKDKFIDKRKCDIDADYPKDCKRTLDFNVILNAFKDLKLLRRVIVPCTTTTTAYCTIQEYKGGVSSAVLNVLPLNACNSSEDDIYSFLFTDCFCTEPSEGHLTASLYVSVKSFYDDYGTSTCCADWLEVEPTGDDYDLEALDTDLIDIERLQPTRAYVLFRTFSFNMPGQSPNTHETAIYLKSVDISSWKLPGSVFSLDSCKQYLRLCGFPDVSVRQQWASGSIPQHTAKVGVELVGIYVDAKLKDPEVKTDIWDYGEIT